jgi:membrane protein DedA with SNARE-associated domain
MKWEQSNYHQQQSTLTFQMINMRGLLIAGIVCTLLGFTFCYVIADTMFELSYWCGVIMCSIGGSMIGSYVFSRKN